MRIVAYNLRRPVILFKPNFPGYGIQRNQTYASLLACFILTHQGEILKEQVMETECLLMRFVATVNYDYSLIDMGNQQEGE